MKLLLSVISLVLVLTACTPPYRAAFDDAATTNHWDKKHELLAFAIADKYFWSKEEKDGQYVFLYSKVPVSKVAAQLASVLADFDDVQSPKEQEWRKYGEVYNLKQDFLHEETVEQTIYARVHAAELENQFKQDLGEMPSGPEAEGLEGYNIKRIYINKPLAEAFPFKSDTVEAAKADGTLKQIEQADMKLDSVYDHKDVDPNNPDDAEAFIWKPKQVSIELTNYKIINTDKPSDNQGNYIEGYRVVDGKKETLPCLKIFFPGSGAAAIVLMDPNREGEPGFGVPQLLETLGSITNIKDVIRDGTILDTLFAEKKKDARTVIAPQLFKIEISHLDSSLDVWEHNTNGYAIPFKYRLGLGDNYNARIVFFKPDVDPNDPDAVAKAQDAYIDIAWIAKEYTSVNSKFQAGPGNVIEYYRAKSQFATGVKAHILSNEDTKKIEFQLPDGTDFQGVISPGSNKFIEDKPFAIAYTEGDGDNGKRWWLEKSVGSDVYDKRKLISPSKDKVGYYSDGPDLYEGARNSSPSKGDTK